MVNRNELIDHINNILNIKAFRDYAPNGLQIEGKDYVTKIACSVTASLHAISVAHSIRADLLLTHHGFFWKNEKAAIVGSKYKRIKALINNGINMAAYHLPLDAHAELGNNAMLAKILCISNSRAVDNSMLWLGEISKQLAGEFAININKQLHTTSTIVNASKVISKIAWCSGAAQNFFYEACTLGVDAYITGEASEHCYHKSLEEDISFISAGHHVTEKYGIIALTEHVAHKFSLDYEFINEDNPF